MDSLESFLNLEAELSENLANTSSKVGIERSGLEGSGMGSEGFGMGSVIERSSTKGSGTEGFFLESIVA